MKFKEGVNPFGIKTELLTALVIADGLWAKHGQALVVTSLNDSVHSKTSLHFSGCAADLRIWGLTNIDTVASALREALGNNPDFDVVVEATHIHLEYQPKYRGQP